MLIPISLATLGGLRVRVDGLRVGVRPVSSPCSALQIVPIQVTLVPLLKLYVDPPFNLMPLAGRDAPAGGLYELWISHTIFALPLAIFLLHNFMREIPASFIESAPGGRRRTRADLHADHAAADDARHRGVRHLPVPLVWNDLLVALVFSSPRSP